MTQYKAWTYSLMVAVCMVIHATGAVAGQVQVAVAANFITAATRIGELFEQATGHRVVYSVGSTGQLYAQITQGAPYDVFLAADRARPQRAVDEGLGVAGSRFTYAVGRLVLFSRDVHRVQDAAALRAPDLTRVAIANAAIAPYGAAAVATLRSLGDYERLAARLVRGQNVAQVYQFVATGNAELGLVALSQVVGHGQGSRWLVPQHLHPPIAQDAVLLRRGAENPAARAFVDYLRSPEVRTVVSSYGYLRSGTGAG